jgi:hypothetical protein
VRVVLNPTVNAVRQPLGQVTGATRAQLRGRDRLTRLVHLQVVGGTDRLVDGSRHHRSRVRRFLDDQNQSPAALFSQLAAPHGSTLLNTQALAFLEVTS